MNKKGLSLVELLAVIVILGIITTLSIIGVNKLLDRSEKEGMDSQKNLLIIATKNFVQDNSEYLPKVVDETVKVRAILLKEKKYLEKEITISKKDCTENSYVEIYKNKRLTYDFTAYIVCN